MQDHVLLTWATIPTAGGRAKICGYETHSLNILKHALITKRKKLIQMQGAGNMVSSAI